MASHRPLVVRIFHTIHKERRIAHNGIKDTVLRAYGKSQHLLRFPRREILQACMHHPHPITERTRLHILAGLSTSLIIDVDTHHMSLSKALSHHQGNQSSARPDVKDTVAPISPCPQQHAISTHFHSTTVLLDFKLLKTESTHFLQLFSSKNAKTRLLFCLFAQKARDYLKNCIFKGTFSIKKANFASQNGFIKEV